MLACRLLACASFLLPVLLAAQSAQRTPVVVELFTSEGCSSCPPADALLARLDREQPIAAAEIIVLGEHVDYWDGLGWHDRFSSPQFTERQKQYGFRFHLGDVYTPQMVVSGVDQFNGADATAASRAIQRAAATRTITLSISAVAMDGKRLTGTVRAEGNPSASGDLYAALVDPIQTTQVRNGENQGRTLQHAGVVRVLSRIGGTKDLARGPLSFSIKNPDATPNMRLVVFAQSPNAGPILGAASQPLAPETRSTSVAHR